VPSEEFVIRKTHNPWYFLNHGVKSGELLKFVRSAESRNYREASKIPAQRVEPMAPVEMVRVSKTPPEKKYTPKKRPRYMVWDISKTKDLYNREIYVRNDDYTSWRTANWDERRKVHDSRRFLKFPYKTPFAWPDERQIDRVAVSSKPPDGFIVHYSNEEIVHFFEGKDHVESLAPDLPQPDVPEAIDKKDDYWPENLPDLDDEERKMFSNLFEEEIEMDPDEPDAGPIPPDEKEEMEQLV